jgi:hypothetical protein
MGRYTPLTKQDFPPKRKNEITKQWASLFVGKKSKSKITVMDFQAGWIFVEKFQVLFFVFVWQAQSRNPLNGEKSSTSHSYMAYNGSHSVVYQTTRVFVKIHRQQNYSDSRVDCFTHKEATVQSLRYVISQCAATSHEMSHGVRSAGNKITVIPVSIAALTTLKRLNFGCMYYRSA